MLGDCKIMGVNVSLPQTGSKTKYLQANDYERDLSNSDESEQFLSESSLRGTSKEKAKRNGQSSSKSCKAGFFQFNSSKGKSKNTFDSLDTIDSRKSVPFAALPDTTRASTSSPSGDNEDLHSIFSDEETIHVSSKNSKVLFIDELPAEDMEQDRVFAEKSAEEFQKKTNQNSGLDLRDTSLLRSK